MKNPLKRLYTRVHQIIYRCPYCRKCPYYIQEKCCDAWEMGNCGTYNKYEKQQTPKEKKP
jgi:hypothetical protein